MDTAYAYIAGVVDGEGSFSITWNKVQATTSYMVTVTNTNRDLVEFVQRHFGGKFSIQSRKCPGAKTVCYQWIATAGCVERFIVSIRPYLIAKREQADIMLEYLKLRCRQPALGLSPEFKRKRIELREKMLTLNNAYIRNQNPVKLTGEELPMRKKQKAICSEITSTVSLV